MRPCKRVEKLAIKRTSDGSVISEEFFVPELRKLEVPNYKLAAYVKV